MKNRIIVGGLLVVVVFIWAAVLLRFQELKSGDRVRGKPAFNEESVKETVLIGTTYELLLNYPDPFLKVEAKPLIHSITTAVTVPGLAPFSKGVAEGNNIVKTNRFDKVHYYGYVGKAGQNKAYGFVNDEGRVFMVSEGDSLFDWRIKLITRDSIIFDNGKESAVIHAF